MDGINLDELRELIAFLKSNGIAEFDMERDSFKVRLKFEGREPAPTPAPDLSPLDLARLSQMVGTPAAPVPPLTPQVAEVAHVAPPVPEASHQVKSPIVGTFYESPSPGAAAFVKVGDHVEVGQILCIIEAMKLMNEIESDMAGEVLERIAITGQPVEYGQPLFAIKPR